MRTIFSFLHFLIKVTLLLAGTVAVVFVFATIQGESWISFGDASNISIGPPRPWIDRFLFDSERNALSAQLQTRADEINSPFSADPGLLSFSVTTGETAEAVAQKLQAMDLISDAQLFTDLLHYNEIDTQLQTGDYQLRRNLSMRQIGEALYGGRSAQSTVTIFPGWRLEQVAQSLHINGVMDANRFYRVAARGSRVDHFILSNRPSGQSYEGYLFPGTYYLLENSTPEELIELMLDNMARQLPPNAKALARQQGLTLYQALTLASIIEREVALDKERPLVASVYLNRLSSHTAQQYLQADPTVQYAMGYQEDANQWWKSPVSLDEYSAVDDPYNTYLYPGLPPGPIANPSLESILAVLKPAQTNYMFFVCRRPGCEGGEHIFAETYEEHLQNVAAYYQQ